MRILYIIFGSLLFLTACENDLEQFPSNIAESTTLTDFADVLNAAYFYQNASATPMAVMGDFRADNALMLESPYTDFDEFNANLTSMDNQFFRPLYAGLYKSILSANNVIDNSLVPTEVAEAKFLRALAYFKLVRVFGDVTVNLSAAPDILDPSILARRPAADVYSQVIIPDLEAAIAALDNSGLASGRASQIAAQGLLGKVYMQIGDFSNAESNLATVVKEAADAGIALQENFADVFNTDLNSEIIFATQLSTAIVDEYGFSGFPGWFSGGDTKSLEPLDLDLVAAFDSSSGDLRRALTINDTLMMSPKWALGLEQDWIELRLADVILLYAEALNENGKTSEALVELNKIRNRAGLENSTSTTQAEVRTAIQNERRLELAFEGQRWFDLVRTGTVDAEMGETINSNYHVFPIPVSEVLSSFGVITQNPGY